MLLFLFSGGGSVAACGSGAASAACGACVGSCAGTWTCVGPFYTMDKHFSGGAGGINRAGSLPSPGRYPRRVLLSQLLGDPPPPPPPPLPEDLLEDLLEDLG